MQNLDVDEQLISVRPPSPLDIHAGWLGRCRDQLRPSSSMRDIQQNLWDRGVEERRDRGTSSAPNPGTPPAALFSISNFPELDKYDERIKYSRDHLLALKRTAEASASREGSGASTFADIRARVRENPEILRVNRIALGRVLRVLGLLVVISIIMPIIIRIMLFNY